jgi:hypothetical protein
MERAVYLRARRNGREEDLLLLVEEGQEKERKKDGVDCYLAVAYMDGQTS